MAIHVKIQRLLLCLAISLLGSVCHSQTINPTEVQYLLNLKSELSLTNEQFDDADSIYFSASQQIIILDKEIQSISRSDLNDEERSSKIRDLNGQKKTIRESRDLSVQLLLNEEQQKIYLEKIKPAKPAVIHMGMNHDRANCNVCIP